MCGCAAFASCLRSPSAPQLGLAAPRLAGWLANGPAFVAGEPLNGAKKARSFARLLARCCCECRAPAQVISWPPLPAFPSDWAQIWEGSGGGGRSNGEQWLGERLGRLGLLWAAGGRCWSLLVVYMCVCVCVLLRPANRAHVEPHLGRAIHPSAVRPD